MSTVPSNFRGIHQVNFPIGTSTPATTGAPDISQALAENINYTFPEEAILHSITIIPTGGPSTNTPNSWFAGVTSTQLKLFLDGSRLFKEDRAISGTELKLDDVLQVGLTHTSTFTIDLGLVKANKGDLLSLTQVHVVQGNSLRFQIAMWWDWTART